MFKTIVTTLIVIVAALLVAAATRLETSRAERAIRISSPPQKIFHYVNDFHQWGVWSPHEKLEPTMTRSFGGATSG